MGSPPLFSGASECGLGRMGMVAYLRYLDTFVKRGGNWLFAERNLYLEFSDTPTLGRWRRPRRYRPSVAQTTVPVAALRRAASRISRPAIASRGSTGSDDPSRRARSSCA